MAPPPIVGRVVGQRQWTDSLYSIQISADINPFEAGQFGRIGLMMDDKPVLRPYSFINGADERPLEFYYVIVKEGPLTARLPHLVTGDEVLINEKANGFLVLSEVPPAEQLWMLATGTGLGPFLSILKSKEVWTRFNDMVLVHAVRYANELTYQEDIQRLLGDGGGRLRYVPFVSRERADFALSGRIPQALTNGALANRAGLHFSPDKSQFMLCGNPQMVKDAVETLTPLGFERNRRKKPGHITVENYW